MYNPDTRAILGTQDTGRRQTTQKHYTIQRDWRHWAHKTQDEDKQHKNTTQYRETGDIGHTRHRIKTNKKQKQHRKLKI